MTPGKNRRRTIFGAVDLRTGRFLCQVTHKAISVSFTAFCEQLLAAYPAAPLVAVVCDNVIIHHSKIVQRWLATHPRIQVLHGARYSPHDNPVERIWGTLKAWLANNPHPDHPGPRPPSGRLLSPAHPRAAAGARRAAQLPLAARGLRAELQGGRSYRSLMRIFVLVRGVLVVVQRLLALNTAICQLCQIAVLRASRRCTTRAHRPAGTRPPWSSRPSWCFSVQMIASTRWRSQLGKIPGSCSSLAEPGDRPLGGPHQQELDPR